MFIQLILYRFSWNRKCFSCARLFSHPTLKGAPCVLSSALYFCIMLSKTRQFPFLLFPIVEISVDMWTNSSTNQASPFCSSYFRLPCIQLCKLCFHFNRLCRIPFFPGLLQISAPIFHSSFSLAKSTNLFLQQLLHFSTYRAASYRTS